MQITKVVLNVSAVVCTMLAGLVALPQMVAAQTLYVPGNQSEQGESAGQEPQIYIIPKSGGFSGNVSSSSSGIYNAPREARPTQRSSSSQNMTARSSRLKEIEDKNIQKAHQDSLENSKRVEQAQKSWRATREAYNKQYFEEEAARMGKQGVAVQNGANIAAGGDQAAGGSGESVDEQPTLYLKNTNRNGLEKPARIFNIFD